MQPENERPRSATARLQQGGTASQLDPHMAPFFEMWLDTFIFHGRLDPRLREFAILRIMWRCNAPLEWGNHYQLARQAGITREEVLSIRTDHPDRDLSGAALLAVRAADQMVDSGILTPQTMTLLADEVSDPALVDEFLYLLGGYRMYASVSGSKREPYSGEHRPWPPDGIGPGTVSD
jgi:hypothetical protein